MARLLNCAYCSKKIIRKKGPKKRYEWRHDRYCSEPCFAIMNMKRHKKRTRKPRVSVGKKLRSEILSEFNNKCAYCFEENKKMRPLCTHHIDDNPMNTVKENLVPLCLSCHRKTQKTARHRHDVFNYVVYNFA